MLKTTNKNSKYWKERKIDWKEHYQNIDHPHRMMLMWILSSIPFGSVWEIGCGAGANLVRVLKDFKGKSIGGSDISQGAIDTCHRTFNNKDLFRVESGDDLSMSDKSADVILTDMVLIYVGPFKIDSYLKEIRRVGRLYYVGVEMHSGSWWKRFKARCQGYHLYDYRKRLEKLGFYDIMVQRLPKEAWPETDKNSEFRCIITARI